MSRQLTQEETEELFMVCERHNVLQYDVQIELVDHLASLIEQHWVKNPKDPFKYALYKAFQKFGPVGFQQVKEQKQRSLARKYQRILWHYLLEFYRWPKMLLTLCLTIGVFIYLKNMSELHWIFVSYAVILFAGAVVYDRRFKTKHRINTVSGKSFLLLYQLKQIQTAALLFCNLPSFSYLIFTISNEISLPTNNFVIFIIALLIVSATMIIYGYFFYIPIKIKEHFMEQFAEFAV